MKLDEIKDEKSLIAYGEEFFDRSAKAKQRLEQAWLLNLAYIAGDQLVSINRHTGALDRINTDHDPEWQIRTVDNRVLPIYRTMMAKLTKNKPMPDAKAHSREESDIQAARAAAKLEENHWKTLELDEKHIELAGWLVATGNVFYKQFWNPKKGDHIEDTRQMDTEAGLNPDGTPQYKDNPQQSGPQQPGEQQVSFNLGDTDLVVRTPFNIYPQPGKTKMRDMTEFGDAEIMDVGEVENIYGKKVTPEKDTKYVKIQSAVGQTGNIATAEMANSVTVKEMYILPCPQFPKGLKFCWAKDVLLNAEEDCPEIPITHFGLIEIPGQFWYKGLIDDVIPLQKRWNQLLSKIEMHNDYYNDPPTIVDESIVPVELWTTEPGLILPSKVPGVDVRGAINTMQVPQLDPAIFKEMEILDVQFEIVPVLNKVSFGKDTANATSGKAINFLQEKDDDIVRPLIDQIESGYAQVFERDFKLCQKYYEEDRGFAIVGEDNKVEWIEFTKANLDANIDVGVEPGSAMPRSKAAQQTMVMDMLNAGFFTNPQTGHPDFPKALKYMEFGSVDDIYQDNALDSNQAKRENEKMKDGTPVEPEDWHNHETHLYEHNRQRKTADYEEFEGSVKQLFSDHIAKHMAFAKPPAPTPVTPGGNAPPQGQPTPADVTQFLQDLKQSNPQMLQQLMSLPQADQEQAIMQAMSAGQ